MGYTHYWRNAKDATPEFIEAARKVIAASPVKLAYEYDQPDKGPEVVDAAPNTKAGDALRRLDGPVPGVRFNGVGDDGHETFEFPSGRPSNFGGESGTFAFCKTAHKPYDTVVVAVLCLVDHFKLASVSSDGDFEDDWEDGLALARKATGLDVKLPKHEDE